MEIITVVLNIAFLRKLKIYGSIVYDVLDEELYW